MSYAGTYTPCPHDSYRPNCEKCILKAQEARGKRDADGMLHSDNGAGWCVGHVVGGLCILRVGLCPVLNTTEEVEAYKAQVHTSLVARAEKSVASARHALAVAEAELAALGG